MKRVIIILLGFLIVIAAALGCTWLLWSQTADEAEHALRDVLSRAQQAAPGLAVHYTLSRTGFPFAVHLRVENYKLTYDDPTGGVKCEMTAPLAVVASGNVFEPGIVALDYPNLSADTQCTLPQIEAPLRFTVATNGKASLRTMTSGTQFMDGDVAGTVSIAGQATPVVSIPKLYFSSSYATDGGITSRFSAQNGVSVHIDAGALLAEKNTDADAEVLKLSFAQVDGDTSLRAGNGDTQTAFVNLNIHDMQFEALKDGTSVASVSVLPNQFSFNYGARNTPRITAESSIFQGFKSFALRMQELEKLKQTDPAAANSSVVDMRAVKKAVADYVALMVQNQTEFVVDKFLLKVKDAEISLRGNVRVDENTRPSGALSITLKNIGELAKLTGDDAAMGMALMAMGDADNPMASALMQGAPITFDVTFRDKFVVLNGMPLAPVMTVQEVLPLIPDELPFGKFDESGEPEASVGTVSETAVVSPTVLTATTSVVVSPTAP